MIANIKWDVSDEDAALIQQICDRAQKAGHVAKRNRLNNEMDIVACHLNGTPLRLADWLAADDFNFSHDLFGIDRHMNRSNGKLQGCFVPRFAAKV